MSNASWVTTSSSGSGSGTVNYTVAANTGAQRTGTITVAGQTFTVTQAAGTCSYALTPTSASVGAASSNGSFTFTTTPATGCSWTAVSNASWITTSSSGSGSGTANYSVAANTGAQRTGTITVTGQTFSVTQAAGACTYALTPTSASVGAAAGSGSFTVTTNPTTGCSWTAVSNASWLTTSSSGSGSGTANYAYAANSGTQRTGTITVAGQTFTVTQAGGTACQGAAQRVLPGGYVAGQSLQVTIQVSPLSSTQVYAAEDVPPAGWAVSGIDNGGQFDAGNGKVKWGPFFDNLARTLHYSVTPPLGTTGTQSFAGTLSVDGVNSAICGATTIAPATFHPADTNNDLRIGISEVTAYGAAWKSGAVWPIPPNPIPIAYVTNAGLLWKLGETYHYDASQTPPWVPGASLLNPNLLTWLKTGLLALSGESSVIAGGTAVSSFNPTSYTPGIGVTVSIVVTPDASTQVYAVEDQPPVGWTVSNINNNGSFDIINFKVK